MSIRCGGVVLALIGVLAATGCAAGPPESVDPTSVEESKSVAPSSTQADPAPPAEAVDLTFGEAEEQVAGDWVLGWLDPFPEDSQRFVFVAAAEGNTAYEYRDSDNECTILTEVFRLADAPMPETDRVLSDTMLAAAVFGSAAAENVESVRPTALVDALWQEAEAATVDFRISHGSSGESGSVVVAARGFGTMAAGMMLTVGCPVGTDAVSEYKEFVRDYARIMVRWPVEDGLNPRQRAVAAFAARSAARATSADPSRSPGPSTSERRVSKDLSFEAGTDLDPAAWRAQWFMSHGGMSMLTPDDGNGNWSMRDEATQCASHFYQGSISGLDFSQDDRTVTDDLLWLFTEATVADATREEVTTYAFDDSVPLFLDSGVVPVRTIWGTSTDGSSWLFSARMFGSMGAGVHLNIVCPAGQDAYDEFDKLRDENLLRVDVGPQAPG